MGGDDLSGPGAVRGQPQQGPPAGADEAGRHGEDPQSQPFRRDSPLRRPVRAEAGRHSSGEQVAGEHVLCTGLFVVVVVVSHCGAILCYYIIRYEPLAERKQ